MGLLNEKTRILDVVLTDRGRELLSQNLLDFEFFAFSDEGVDYASALTASLLESGSVDEYMRRSLTFEATQQRDFREQKDLKSFLYTIPSRRRTLPEFVTNFDDRLSITAKRKFFIDTLILSAKRRPNRIKSPLAVIMRSTKEKGSRIKKLQDYALKQKVEQTEVRLVEGKNVAGLAIGISSVMLNSNRVLNTESGLVQNIESFRKDQSRQPAHNVGSVKKELEVVSGLDRIKIDLQLKSSEGQVDDPSGYFIEVFESGSDGTVTKLIEETIKDVLEENIVQKGFSQDLFMDIDVTSEELINQGRLVRRSQLRKREVALRRLRKKLVQKVSNRR